MDLTTNYGLKKPSGADVVNIDDFNYNADILDREIKSIRTKLDGLNLTASNVKMNDGSTVEETVSANKTSNLSLQNELGANKTTLQANINAIREVL